MRFLTFGCKVNQAESEAIAAEVAERGLPVVDAETADIVVVNSCTVTAEADRKVRKAVRHALASERRPTVIVTGCLAALHRGALSVLGERVLVVADKARVADAVAEVARRAHATSGTEGRPADAPSRQRTEGHWRVTGTEQRPLRRVRVQVKVQDGCDAGCAYCIVPAARGRPRSVPTDEVVRTVARLAEEGVVEVVLTGINIGRYEDGAVRLPGLVAAVAATGIRRVRLSSVEPTDIDDALLGVLASTPSLCRHLHVPLQSGSDRVLRSMGRPYDTERYEAVLTAVREALPGCAFTTDVLAGFPGESDADAQETVSFVAGMGFARLHVFRFSARPGTRAAVMPDQVPAETRLARAAELRAVSADLAEGFARRAIGSVVEVLVERRVGDGLVEGTTREYLRVRLDEPDAEPGEVFPARVTGLATDGVALGRRVSPERIPAARAW